MAGLAIAIPGSHTQDFELTVTATATETANGDSATTTATITVVAPNTAPVADDDAASTAEDTPLVISPAALLANDSDTDGDTLSIAAVGSAIDGTVTRDGDGTIVFTPDADFNGTASFEYTAADEHGATATATVTVDVTPVNDASLAMSLLVAIDEDTTATGTLTATDADGDALTFSLSSGPSHGTATVNADGSYTYAPTADYNGADSFTYAVGDGNGGTSTATVNVTVVPVNDAPVADVASTAVNEDTSVTGSLSASDVDGDALTFSLSSGPAHGSATVNADGTYTYAADADYNGTDSFTYAVDDGNGGVATGTVEVTVDPVNDAPVVAGTSVTVNEDSSLNASLAASDVDGDGLTFSLASGPSHGSATVHSDGTFTYAPTADFNGGDSFTYTVADGNGGWATGTASVTVDPVNDAPVPGTTAIAADEDVAVTGSLTASDVDGDGLTFSLVSGPGQGCDHHPGGWLLHLRSGPLLRDARRG